MEDDNVCGRRGGGRGVASSINYVGSGAAPKYWGLTLPQGLYMGQIQPAEVVEKHAGQMIHLHGPYGCI